MVTHVPWGGNTFSPLILFPAKSQSRMSVNKINVVYGSILVYGLYQKMFTIMTNH